MRLNAFIASLEEAGCVHIPGVGTALGPGTYHKLTVTAKRPYGSTVIYYQLPGADKAFERTFDWKEDYRGERERN